MRASTSDITGREFEREVADVYRSLGYHVTPGVTVQGQQADLIASRRVDGAPPIRLYVECKDHGRPISNQLVQDFVSTATALKARGAITAAVMVARSGFTDNARGVVDGLHDIDLLSLDDLADATLVVRSEIGRRIADYEREQIFSTYVEPHVEHVSWLGSGGNNAPRVRDLRTAVLRLLRNSGRRLRRDARALFIVADFGAGKTTIMRRIEYWVARQFYSGEEQYIPLFVNLREYRDVRDVDALLTSSFRESYLKALPASVLWRHMDAGRMVVLLDGFDEMVERSDPALRAELFAKLLPIVHSTSPVLLTSRPSLFVDKGELSAVVGRMRNLEIVRAGGGSGEGLPGLPGEARDLRRRLVQKHREVRLKGRGLRSLEQADVQLLRLLPFDREQIRAFAESRSTELAQVGTSAQAFLDLLDRTYDLSDLASRPLLLSMILETVLAGALSPDDRTERGPSALYELYTSSKIELDLAKGAVRRQGLPAGLRVKIAELLAVEMLEAGVLEVDLEDALLRLVAEHPDLGLEISETGLTQEQVKADFATCSFVTLSDRESCRYVHKSFRGFFVARVLSRHLAVGHRLLGIPLDWEVLYFLGGFAPGEPSVRRAIGDWVRECEGSDVVRRNALLAWLYTTTNHDSLVMVGEPVEDCEFGSLTFSGSRLERVDFRRIVARRILDAGGAWQNVQIEACDIADLQLNGGSYGLALKDGTVVERLGVEGGVFELDARRDATVGRLSFLRCEARVDVVPGRLEHVRSEGSTVTVDVGAAGIDLACWSELVVEGGSVRFVGAGVGDEASVGRVEASSTVLDLGHASVVVRDWMLRSSVLRVGDGVVGGPVSRASLAGLRADEGSLVLGCPAHSMSAVPCGFVGSVEGTVAEGFERRVASRPWGVVVADDYVAQRAADVARWGDVLVVSRSWFQAAVAPGGEFEALGTLLEGPTAIDLRRDGALGTLIDDFRSALRLVVRYAPEGDRSA